MKLKNILPFATIASVATVVVPLVSCSCSNGIVVDLNECKEFEPKTQTNGEDSFYYLTNKDAFESKQDVEYTFNIDLNNYNWTGMLDAPQTVGMFAVSDSQISEETSEPIPLLNVQIEIDGVPLTEDTTASETSELDNNSFCLNEGVGYRFDTITVKSKIIIKGMLEFAKDKAWAIFLPIDIG